MNEGVKLDTHSNPYGPSVWRGGTSDHTVDPLGVSIYTFSPGSKLIIILHLTHQNGAAVAKAFARTLELFDNDTASLQSNSKTLLTEGLSDIKRILLLVTSFSVGQKITIPSRGEFVSVNLWIALASVDCAQILELYESRKTKLPAKKQISFVHVSGGSKCRVIVSARRALWVVRRARVERGRTYCLIDTVPTKKTLEIVVVFAPRISGLKALDEQVLGCPVLESYSPPVASKHL